MKAYWQCPNCGAVQATRIRCWSCRYGNWIAPLAIFLIACSGDAFTGFEGGTPKDTGGDSDADSSADDAGGDSSNMKLDGGDGSASDACATQSGTAQCKDVLGAYCLHYVQCYGGDSANQQAQIDGCLADCAPRAPGLDCNAAKYTGQVCVETNSACLNFAKTTACGNLVACGTLTQPCKAFWGQF